MSNAIAVANVRELLRRDREALLKAENDGDLRAAVSLAQRVLGTAEKERLDSKSAEHRSATAILGHALCAANKYERAEPLLLKASRSIIGTEDENTCEHAIILSNLAATYVARELPQKAISLFVQCISIKRQLGKRDNAMHGNLEDLVICFENTNRFGEAVPYLEQMLDMTREKVGVRHQRYAKALQNLALGYQHAGRHSDARRLRDEAAAILKSLSANADVELADIDRAVDTAIDLYRRGNVAEAATIHRSVLSRLPQFTSVVQGNLLDPFMAKAAEIDRKGVDAQASGDFKTAGTCFWI